MFYVKKELSSLKVYSTLTLYLTKTTHVNQLGKSPIDKSNNKPMLFSHNYYIPVSRKRGEKL